MWANESPFSTRYCRSIQFHYVKESEEVVKEITNEIEKEICTLKETCFQTFNIKHKLMFTMVDGKIINIKTGTKSAMKCYLCNALPKEMNNLNTVSKGAVNKNNLSFGLSSLHAWIRSFECILHIAYNLPFRSWSARTEEQKIANWTTNRCGKTRKRYK